MAAFAAVPLNAQIATAHAQLGKRETGFIA
jgi:hypothetical protein